MKKSLLGLILLCQAIVLIAQEKKDVNLFKTDSTWFKETIQFPINFAQNIKFEGFEELRFPPGWAKEDSPEFWSYMWAWSLNGIKELTEEELETNIQYYFDGLLGLDDSKTPKTTALFIKKDSKGTNPQYIGKVHTFDTRFTNTPMTLHVTVENYYCKTKNKAILVFRFSPKEFNNTIWSTLNSVKLVDGACEID